MTKPPVRRPRASLVTSLAEPPRMQAADTPDNIKEKKDVDMNFKVPPDFKREFKVSAATHGLKQRELLFECYKVWKESLKKR